MTRPFDYPTGLIVRRHAPGGYERPIGYRPWLRDEFSFRCVFCLQRETWIAGDLQVEHFEPAALVPERILDYSNLLYACHVCNGKKGAQSIPDPCRELTREDIALGDEGRLIGRTEAARAVIAAVGLNSKRLCKFREMWNSIIELARQYDPVLYSTLMSYPVLLPDLDRLRPPGGNAKPEGLDTSYRTRRLRGELPETY
jgi:hypothetical protein